MSETPRIRKCLLTAALIPDICFLYTFAASEIGHLSEEKYTLVGSCWVGFCCRPYQWAVGPLRRRGGGRSDPQCRAPWQNPGEHSEIFPSQGWAGRAGGTGEQGEFSCHSNTFFLSSLHTVDTHSCFTILLVYDCNALGSSKNLSILDLTSSFSPFGFFKFA